MQLLKGRSVWDWSLTEQCQRRVSISTAQIDVCEQLQRWSIGSVERQCM
jgi:hypothetical protein